MLIIGIEYGFKSKDNANREQNKKIFFFFMSRCSLSSRFLSKGNKLSGK